MQGEEEGGLMEIMNDWAKRNKSDIIEDRKVFVLWLMSAMDSCMIVGWVSIIATSFEHYKEGKHLQIHMHHLLHVTHICDWFSFLNRFTMWWGYNHPSSCGGDLMDWNLDYFQTAGEKTDMMCVHWRIFLRRFVQLWLMLARWNMPDTIEASSTFSGVWSALVIRPGPLDARIRRACFLGAFRVKFINTCILRCMCEFRFRSTHSSL